jgi:hypothetical protein
LTQLVAHENERVTSRLQAGFNGAGDLVLEGYDVGSFVEEVWGDSDYEYWLTVHSEEIPRLVEELVRETGELAPTAENQPPFVMGVLKKFFTEGHAPVYFKNDSEFKKWLDARGIPSDFSSWP